MFDLGRDRGTSNKGARDFTCAVSHARLEIHLDRDQYRERRRFDGVFVLETNHQSMSAEEVVACYRRLMVQGGWPSSHRAERGVHVLVQARLSSVRRYILFE